MWGWWESQGTKQSGASCGVESGVQVDFEPRASWSAGGSQPDQVELRSSVKTIFTTSSLTGRYSNLATHVLNTNCDETQDQRGSPMSSRGKADQLRR